MTDIIYTELQRSTISGTHQLNGHDPTTFETTDSYSPDTENPATFCTTETQNVTQQANINELRPEGIRKIHLKLKNETITHINEYIR